MLRFLQIFLMALHILKLTVGLSDEQEESDWSQSNKICDGKKLNDV